jgi:uncharacterized protein (DUF1800 family)
MGAMANTTDDTAALDTEASETADRIRGRRRLLIGGTALALAACTPRGGGGASTDAGPPTTLARSDRFVPNPGAAAGVGVTVPGPSSTTSTPTTSTPTTVPEAWVDGTAAAEQPVTIEPTSPPPTSPPARVRPRSITTAEPVPTTTSTTEAPPTTTAPPETTTTAPTTTAPPTTAPPTTAPPTTVAPTSTTALATTTTALATTTTAPPETTTTTAPTTTAPPETTTTAPPEPEVTLDAFLVMSKLSFGITESLSAEVSGDGADAWVEQQLALTGPDPYAEALLDGYATLAAPIDTVRTIVVDQGTSYLRREISMATLVRARYSTHQLFEQLCQLWNDHLNAPVYTMGWSWLQAHYNEAVIRAHAMGRYVDLLVASAHAPAMLYYLDNHISNANSAQGVNENYGRELLELHTLGIEPDGTHVYTEDDMRGVAKVMSGWSIDSASNSSNRWAFQFKAAFHSTEAVSILGGQWSRPAVAAADGKASGDDLLQFLARHPSTARHIARKLIRRFVTDAPPESLVASAAAVYLANDTAIVPVLRHILASNEFRSSEAHKLRRPLEVLAAGLRALEANVPSGPHTNGASSLLGALVSLGQEPWGWGPPDGYPDVAEPWLGSDGLMSRWNFLARIPRNTLTNASQPGAVTVDLRGLIGDAEDLGRAMDRLAARLGLTWLTPAERDGLLGVVGLSPAQVPSAATDADLAELAGFLLAGPQFHVR